MSVIGIQSSGLLSKAPSLRADAMASGREGLFATGGPGQFSGEVSDLAGHASLAMVCAGPDGCTAYPFDLPHLRALLISSADIGEVMMRAFILRRAAFLEGGGVGSVILGEAASPGYGSASRLAHPQQLSALADRCGWRRRQGSGRTSRRACPPICRS